MCKKRTVLSLEFSNLAWERAHRDFQKHRLRIRAQRKHRTLAMLTGSLYGCLAYAMLALFGGIRNTTIRVCFDISVCVALSVVMAAVYAGNMHWRVCTLAMRSPFAIVAQLLVAIEVLRLLVHQGSFPRLDLESASRNCGISYRSAMSNGSVVLSATPPDGFERDLYVFSLLGYAMLVFYPILQDATFIRFPGTRIVLVVTIATQLLRYVTHVGDSSPPLLCFGGHFYVSDNAVVQVSSSQTIVLVARRFACLFRRGEEKKSGFILRSKQLPAATSSEHTRVASGVYAAACLLTIWAACVHVAQTSAPKCEPCRALGVTVAPAAGISALLLSSNIRCSLVRHPVHKRLLLNAQSAMMFVLAAAVIAIDVAFPNTVESPVSAISYSCYVSFLLLSDVMRPVAARSIRLLLVLVAIVLSVFNATMSALRGRREMDTTIYTLDANALRRSCFFSISTMLFRSFVVLVYSRDPLASMFTFDAVSKRELAREAIAHDALKRRMVDGLTVLANNSPTVSASGALAREPSSERSAGDYTLATAEASLLASRETE